MLGSTRIVLDSPKDWNLIQGVVSRCSYGFTSRRFDVETIRKNGSLVGNPMFEIITKLNQRHMLDFCLAVAGCILSFSRPRQDVSPTEKQKSSTGISQKEALFLKQQSRKEMTTPLVPWCLACSFL